MSNNSQSFHCAAEFMYGFVTTKDDDGDIKLAGMCEAMDQAGLFHTTYDAKSGAAFRITLIGATEARLEAFADAKNVLMGLQPIKIKAACVARGLVLEVRSCTWCLSFITEPL